MQPEAIFNVTVTKSNKSEEDDNDTGLQMLKNEEAETLRASSPNGSTPIVYHPSSHLTKASASEKEEMIDG